MGKWYGYKTEGGDVSDGTEDLLQDTFKQTGYSHLPIIHFFFYCEQECEVEVDGESMWLDAGKEIEFSTEFDARKMPVNNFKILTADVTYQYNIIIG